MNRDFSLRTLAIVALLMPGLVLAAPTAGACGHCGDGAPCATMATPAPVAEAHSCCSEGAADTPAESASSRFGAKACDCGHEAPEAVSTAEAPAPANDRAEGPRTTSVFGGNSQLTAPTAGRRSPLPPPSPPIFLIDCVFLT